MFINPDFVYLDTCSTFHQNINENSITNICMVSCGMKSHSNSGVSRTNNKANYGEFLRGLETWFQEQGLANIILFHKLEIFYPITYAHQENVRHAHERSQCN